MSGAPGSMRVGMAGVKYGLSVRKPAPGKPAAAKKPMGNVFGGGDSDSDDEETMARALAAQQRKKEKDAKAEAMHAAALAEDPNAFDYDGVYDDMKAAKKEPKQAEKLERKSKYIENLLEKAKEREREDDIVYERRLARERAVEDHLYGDKEKFVTSAYKAKLAEREEYLREEKMKEMLEEANCVTKKKDMSDFFRNMYKDQNREGKSKAKAKDEPPPAAAAAAAAAAVPDRPPWEEEEEREREEEMERRRRENRERQGAGGAGGRGGGSAAAAGAAGAAAGGGGSRERVAEQERSAARARDREGRGEGAAGRGGGDADADAKAKGEEAPAAPPEEAAAPAAPPPPAQPEGRRNDGSSVLSARERYLARKRERP